MPRSAAVSVPQRPLSVVHERRPSLGFEEILPTAASRDYDSWPCDSFFLLPDSVLSMDATAFRDDLRSLDPVLSASLPDWPDVPMGPLKRIDSSPTPDRETSRFERKALTLMDNHEGLTFLPVGKGTVLIGGGGDVRVVSSSGGAGASSNAPGDAPSKPSVTVQNASSAQNKSQTTSQSHPIPSQKDRSSGLCFKDREERVRHMRERQQNERQQKLEELKEQAASAQKFREQQETLRRQRQEEMRQRDTDRRVQVEERRRILESAEKERREASLRRNVDREQRIELKRRQERSNAVFAFGSSTPRMLDPKENSAAGVWTARRATSTTNVNMTDPSAPDRRTSECTDSDLSRKRATSAHSLNRKPDELRMSSSMYEVFHWDDNNDLASKSQTSPSGTRLTKSRDSSLERRARSFAPRSLASTPEPSKQPYFFSLQTSPSVNTAPSLPTPNSTGLSIWEFGDNFSALGPSAKGAASVPNPTSSLPSPTSPSKPPIPAPSIKSSPRNASVRKMVICTRSGEDTMTRSLIAAAPATAARRRTDLFPALPSMRDPGLLKGSSRHRSPGVSSGTTTPGSPSRPTSALSQGSSGAQVIMRARNIPRKPRPLSIAGSTPSSADKPHENASAAALPGRESRPVERKSSVGSTPSAKPSRAKSAGSDNGSQSTPSKTPSRVPATPKRTPAQVKAESAARKAAERSKSTPKARTTPRSTPLASPSVDAKPLPGAEKKPSKLAATKESKSKDVKQTTVVSTTVKEVTITKDVTKYSVVSTEVKDDQPQIIEVLKDESQVVQVQEDSAAAEVSKPQEETIPTSEQAVSEIPSTEAQIEPSVPDEVKPTVSEISPLPSDTNTALTEATKIETTTSSQEELNEKPDQSLAQKAAEKPVTGYATEEDYKQALAEKRRQAREAKERELELERLRILEEEQKERQEEEEYLRLVEEQRKCEEERLQKAIEEAAKQREIDAKLKEEEEQQRIEAERLEKIKQAEAEEKVKKEEEERQARKSRVAQIMARTRGKGTPSKVDEKSPEEGKSLNDSINMSESFIATMSNSMTDSMIAQAIESRDEDVRDSITENETIKVVETKNDNSNQSSEEITISQPSPSISDISSQPSSDISTTAPSTIEMSSQPSSVSFQSQSESESGQTSIVSHESITIMESVSSNISTTKTEGKHMNGDTTVPMETTPTIQSIDLLESFNGGIHNGIQNGKKIDRIEHSFDSMDPFAPSETTTVIDSKSENVVSFDQIIDLSQTRLTNEDAVNSNPPPPIIAFEDNINKKQHQDTSSNVPDLLL